ncbi:hypothetical protein CP02DC14_1909A, partial [Chlamydia psittaci 02DC14]
MTGSNHSRPGKTGFHWLKPVLIRLDRIKPDQAGS